MRICHITYSFPPGIGGTEKHNYSLVKYLLERGHDVDVIVLRPSCLSKKSIANAKNSVNKGMKIHNIYPKPFPLWIFQVRNQIKDIEKEGEIDVFDIHSAVHTLPLIFQKRKVLFSLHFYELSCPLVETAPRPCTLTSFRKCWRCCGPKRYLKWKIVNWIAVWKTSKFMVKHNYLKDKLIQHGVSKEKIKVIPYWIDIDNINEKNKQKAISIATVTKSDSVIIHVGRLVNFKGIFILLRAFELLSDRVRNAKLVFVGDGDQKEKMENFCHKHRITDAVLFLGFIKKKQVPSYLSMADVFVMASPYDNYNWSLLEAMSAQKPIVATNVAATTEILKDNCNALLAEPSPKSLCSSIQKVLENHELARKIAKNAFETVKEKHSMKNLEKYEKLLKSM